MSQFKDFSYKRFSISLGVIGSLALMIFSFQNAAPVNGDKINLGVQPNNQEFYKNPV